MEKMKQAVLIFSTLVMNVLCDDGIGVFESPILSIYPCNDTKDIVVWFEPGLPPKERNQYYLYVNKRFPAKVQISSQFNAGVDIIVNIRTSNNTYMRQFLKQGVETTRQFKTYNPEFLGYGYKVKGTEPGKIPYLTSFVVNEVEYCSQPNVGFLDAYASNDVDGEPQKNCGRRKVIHTELIVNGAQSKPGDWPWHAAIYRIDYSSIRYICGGSLLSTHFILTAAHCATLRGVPVLPEILNIVLGKYNLFGGDIGSEEREVHRIIIHENFEYRSLNNDIALLKLKTDVVFTDYIQPACLWYSKATEKLLTDDIVGMVVGWGFDNRETLSRTIKQAQMPIIADSVCMRSNSQFYSNVLNGYKFCAGYRNGTSACNGDSGSAFQVFVSDSVKNGVTSSSGVWLVRGIVSLTLSRHDTAICDPNQYVVFTDVEKFLPWIQNYLDGE